MTLALYDAPRSNNCRKVRLLAAELELPLELRRLDFGAGEQRSAGYLAKNPNGKIPTLEDDGFVLWESGAILRWLADKRPERGLVPADPQTRALLDQWMFWWAAHPESALATLLYERRIKAWLGHGEPDASITDAAERELARFLPVLEHQLGERDHVLSELSIVDFFIAPSLEMGPALGVDLARYPNLTAWLQRLATRPYWQAA